MGAATATATPTWDVDKAVTHLRDKAEPKPTKYCARYTANAVEAGFGLKQRLRQRPIPAKDFGPWLVAYGFEPVHEVAAGTGPDGLTFQKGDVAVIEAFTVPNPKNPKKPTAHKHGHLQMFDGSAWISDFKQTRGPNGFWAGKGYEAVKPGFVIYRYKPPEAKSEQKAEDTPVAAGGGVGYLTEAATLQCLVCGGKVELTGKGDQAWKIKGSPVLTAEGLKGAPVVGCRQPPAGLGCTQVKDVVTGKAGKTQARSKTPLLAGAMAMTDKGGLVVVAAPNPTAAKTGSTGANGPPEKPPEKVHSPGAKKPGALKFRLVDQKGNGVPDEWFRVTLPDGAEAHGVLDADGRGAVTGIEPGAKCRLAFPNLKYTRWYPEGRPETAADTHTAADGDTLSALAGQCGLPNWQTLWNYPANAPVRADRCEPEPLAPGKQVFVPRPDRELAAGDDEHRLVFDQCHPARTATFRFVDATTGAPLPDLTVAILRPDFRTDEAVTDRNGEVVIDGRPGEVYTVTRVIRPGLLALGDPSVFRAPARRSLDDLLRDTLIGATDPATRVNYADRASGPPAFTPAAARPATGTGVGDVPRWDVTIPPEALNQVTGLTCVVPGCHSGHAELVCESIEWDPFAVHLPAGEVRPPLTGRLTLPLDAAHLVRVQSLEGGRIPRWRPGAVPPPPHPGGGLVWPRLPQGRTHVAPPPPVWPGNRLWPLEAQVDLGFQNVFAYQLDADPNGGSPAINPVPDAVCRHDRFLPPVAPGPITVAIGGRPVDVPVVRFRAVVVTSLVCNKARNDFEPGGVMDAARVYPVAMIVASMPLEAVAGGVRVVRPPTKVPHDPATMRPYLRAGLFTDSNTVVIPFPDWGTLFAYYNVDSPNGTYTVVHRRTGSDTPLGWGSSQATRKPRAAGAVTEAMADKLEKLPGQGSYDNVHIAPPMFVDPAPTVPLTGPDQARAAGTFADISMAPFCVHDCFHTHWRWAPPKVIESNQRERLGWSLAGEPYSTPGAPLVPPNQTVAVTVAGAGFHYRAEAAAPDPGRWQVVMHHGSGYSVAEASVFPSAGMLRTGYIELLRQTVPNQTGVSGGGVWLPRRSSDWALFYWHLRYTVWQPLYSLFGQIDPGSFRHNNAVAADPILLAAAVAG